MKKKFFAIAACVALGCAFMLSSCSKSNQALIDDLRDVATEMKEAQQNGNMEKVVDLTKKATEIASELEKRELTPEEQAEIASIALSCR